MNHLKEENLINQKETINYKKVFTIAGSTIALLIGSGFATGQEVMQYIASFSWTGLIGAVIITVLLTYTALSFVTVGHHHRFKTPNDIFKFYTGKTMGTLFDYYSIFLLYMSCIVMISGAGTTLNEQYGWPIWVGASLLTFSGIIVVILGLENLTNIIGNVGPLIIILALGVSVISIINNWDNLPVADQMMQEAVANGDVIQAADNFLISAANYAGFAMMWLVAFLGQVGRSANSGKEGRLGAGMGTITFGIGVVVLAIALILSIGKIGDSQVPALILAQEIAPWMGGVFSILVFLGIFSSCVPLLWTVIARFSNEGTTKYNVLTFVLSLTALVISLSLDFELLVNYVYVLNGYIGLVLMAIVIVGSFFRFTSGKRTS